MIIWSSVCAAPHSMEAIGESGEADDGEVLAPEARGDPAHRRGHDRGGDDVGGEHPGDLVARGGRLPCM